MICPVCEREVDFVCPYFGRCSECVDKMQRSGEWVGELKGLVDRLSSAFGNCRCEILPTKQKG